MPDPLNELRRQGFDPDAAGIAATQQAIADFEAGYQDPEDDEAVEAWTGYPPVAFGSWAALREYCEDRDHAGYSELTCGQLMSVYVAGERAGL